MMPTPRISSGDGTAFGSAAPKLCFGNSSSFSLSHRDLLPHVSRVPGLIAIVGRPNVGKSALFNRIVRRRIAIVHDQPGVTRDRISAEAEWHGHPFTLVDTGGIGLLRREKATDVIIKAALEQVQVAIEAANVIIFVVNVQEGVVALDREAAARLRQSGKPVLVAVNKVDTSKAETGVAEFAELGFERILPVSAIHGEGIEELMEEAWKECSVFSSQSSDHQPEVAASDDTQKSSDKQSPSPLKLAIIGRPNVGKSSIINALTKSERVVVSPIPGTTRDAVDVPFEVETEGVRESYILIDTAGMRKTRGGGGAGEVFFGKKPGEGVGGGGSEGGGFFGGIGVMQEG